MSKTNNLTCFRNYYTDLGLSLGASLSDIRAAYAKLSKQLPPTSPLGGRQAKAAHQKIYTAYQVLSNSDKRAQYDATFGPSLRRQQQQAKKKITRRSNNNTSPRPAQQQLLLLDKSHEDYFREVQERVDQRAYKARAAVFEAMGVDFLKQKGLGLGDVSRMQRQALSAARRLRSR